MSKNDKGPSDPVKVISDGVSILGGTYFNGRIVLEEESDHVVDNIPASIESLKALGPLTIGKKKDEQE